MSCRCSRWSELSGARVTCCLLFGVSESGQKTEKKKTVKNSSALYARLLPSLLDEKVLYKTLKGSISATYLEPLKGYSYTPKKKGSSVL